MAQHPGHARLSNLSLALQGGGSFGAYTWGVLDRLLEEPELGFDMVSGTSAGAVNAALLAAGLAEAQGAAGREAARKKLAEFWDRVSRSSAPPFMHLMQSVAASVLSLRGSMGSPQQLNPLGLNPLRDMLAEAVDFERLREIRPLRLLIAATRVRDGRLVLFREHELTLDMVLASACLPQLSPAVEIGGDVYWDGGFASNPPLRDLVQESKARDVLLVRILPEIRPGLPHTGGSIARRINEIAFTAPLQRELEAIDDLRAACKGVLPSAACRHLSRIRLHQLAAEEDVEGLDHESSLDTSPALIARLREAGHRAADAWLRGYTINDR